MISQKWKVKLFGLFNVPMIGFANPTLVSINDRETVVKVPLNWRTRRRDIGSMYLGSLVVGADLASAVLAFFLAEASPHDFSIIFKTLTSEFLKRPESDVFFRCAQGEQIRKTMDEAVKSGVREAIDVEVTATSPKTSGDEIVARFVLGLTLKVKKKK